MRFRRSLWVFVVLLFGCLEPIDVVTAKVGGELVISGQISTLEDQSSVTIGTTAEIERLPYPVSGATVTIYENGDSIGSYIENDKRAGKYILKGYTGLPGQVYQIRVMLSDQKTYWSHPEKMPEEAGTVATYYEHAREEYVDGEGALTTKNFIKVYANSSLPSAETRFFRWIVEEVYIIVGSNPPGTSLTSPPCFITQLAEPQYIVLLDRVHLAATETHNRLVARRLVDESFLYQHYFVTYQSALTPEAFDYWRKVDILLSGTGSLFDPPPAKLYGNIFGSEEQGTEKIFGYFQATNQTVSRIFTLRQDFPYYLSFSDCQGSYLPLRCTDCLSVQNSSHDRPPWF
jgi:hypothetical protein